MSAENFGVTPMSVYRSELIDERFDGDRGEDRTFYACLIHHSDDWGHFEGDSGALARDMGVHADYVSERLASLENRGLISLYKAPGRIRQVGEITHYDDLDGFTKRRANPSQRGAAKFPDRDGHYMGARRARRNQRTPDVGEACNNDPGPSEPYAEPVSSRSKTPVQLPSKESAPAVGPVSNECAQGEQPVSNPGATVVRLERRGEERRGAPSRGAEATPAYAYACEGARASPPARLGGAPAGSRAGECVPAHEGPVEEGGRSGVSPASGAGAVGFVWLRGESVDSDTDSVLNAYPWPLSFDEPVPDAVQSALERRSRVLGLRVSELRARLWRMRHWPSDERVSQALSELRAGPSSWLVEPERVRVWLEQLPREPVAAGRAELRPAFMDIGRAKPRGVLVLAEDVRLALSRVLAGGFECESADAESFARWRSSGQRSGCGWHDADRAYHALLVRALRGEEIEPPREHREVFLARWGTLTEEHRGFEALVQVQRAREGLLSFAVEPVVQAVLAGRASSPAEVC